MHTILKISEEIFLKIMKYIIKAKIVHIAMNLIMLLTIQKEGNFFIL